MIYATLIRRYLLPYLLYSVLSAIAVTLIILTFDGFITYLAFFFFLLVVVFLMPFLVYCDYREIKQHLKNLNEMRKSGKFPEEYIEKTIEITAEKTGVPGFIVNYFVYKTISVTKIARTDVTKIARTD